MSTFKDFNKYWNNYFANELSDQDIFNHYVISGEHMFLSDVLTGRHVSYYEVFVNFTWMQEEFLYAYNSPRNSKKLWQYLADLLNSDSMKLTYLPDRIEYYSNHSHDKVKNINKYCLIFDRFKSNKFQVEDNLKYFEFINISCIFTSSN